MDNAKTSNRQDLEFDIHNSSDAFVLGTKGGTAVSIEADHSYKGKLGTHVKIDRKSSARTI